MSKVLQLQETSADDRRTMFGASGETFSVVRVEVKNERRRIGGHAHREMDQVLIFSEEAGIVLTCRVDEKGQALEEVQRHEVTDGTVLEVPRMTACSVYLPPGAVYYCVSNVPFDAAAREKSLIDCPWLSDDSAAAQVW